MRLVNLIPIAILCCLLIAASSMSATSNWNIGVIFGGNTQYFSALDLTAGQVWGGFLVLFSLSQLVWGPLFGASWRDGNRTMMMICGGMAVVSLSLSMVTGIAWQYARADLVSRENAQNLQRWDSSTETIRQLSAATKDVVPRGRAVIEADIAAVLGTTVKIRGRGYRVDALTKSCAKDHYAARKQCRKFFELKKEQARRLDYDGKQKAKGEAAAIQSASLAINTEKFFEFFKDLFALQRDQVLEGWMVGLQAICELLQTLLPVCIVFLWWGMWPPGTYKTRRDVPINGASNAASGGQVAAGAFSVIDGGAAPRVDKTALLRRFLREGQLKQAVYVPGEFMHLLNDWCHDKGLPRFHQKEVGGVWFEIGGEKDRYYVETTNSTSARTAWVLPGRGQQKFNLGAAA